MDVHQTQASARDDTHPRSDVYADLVQMAGERLPREIFYCRAFRRVAEHFASPYAVTGIQVAGSHVQDTWTTEGTEPEQWREVVDALHLEAESQNESLARLYHARTTDVTVIVMSALIREDGGRTVGAMTVVAACRDEMHAEVLLSELRALTALVSGSLPEIGEIPDASTSGSDLGRAVVKAAQYRSMHELAFAITNRLRNRIGCEQVALGMARGANIRLLSISGFDDLAHRSPGASDIRQAMEECLDQASRIVVQNDDKWADQELSTAHRLHRAWSESTGRSAVVSMPLIDDDRVVAVLSLRRVGERPFRSEELEKVANMVEPMGASLLLVRRASRRLIPHIVESTVETGNWFITPRSWGRKIIGILLVALTAWFCLGTMNYRVTVPCVIAPSEVHHFAAPFEGVIKASYVEAGDQVAAGQLLYELETRELELERAQYESERSVTQLDVDAALAESNLSAASVAAAQMQVFDAKIAIIDRRIEQARVHAREPGVVLVGDLETRIGQVVSQGEPLLELAPQRAWVVELLVPEATVTDLENGLTGRFASHARPGDFGEIEVGRIGAASESRNGRNVFVAEAGIDDVPSWMRVGMEGVASVDAGERPVWWVTLHGVVDWFRMRFWL